MAEKETAPYGSWKSPITSDLIVEGSIMLQQIELDGDDMYWIEVRPAESGRSVIVRRSKDGRTEDVNPPPFSARSRVHEYGGAPFTVHQGTVYFVSFDDHRLYRAAPGQSPQAITPEGAWRYANMVVDESRDRLICVREDHSAEGQEAVNTIVAVPLSGGHEQAVLISGNDFYSSPRLSPDGMKLAWLTWNHPNMPWDGTELWVGTIGEGGAIENATRVAGSATESIFQPEWSPDGALYFVSDRTNWWNIYRLKDGLIEAMTQRDAEFGMPQWAFGMAAYGFVSAGEILCVYRQGGSDHLARLDTSSKALQDIDLPYTVLGGIRVTPSQAVFLGRSPATESAVIRLSLPDLTTSVLRRSSEVTVDPGYISVPEAIEFPTENGKTAHAFFYPPQNMDYQAPPGELPPLIVESHGGPTGATTSAFDLSTQYWTSRGVAVVDVNYGGSSGYGREYRERLYGEWGVVDVDDCVNAARYLVEQGRVDPNKLAIVGGSAGGYTTLAAITFRDVFRAGASHFGLSELESFVNDTHKFESRYLIRLIGPYPERRDLYYERSPINFTDRINCPVILFQGLDDRVVPPKQAELIVEALERKGMPYAYLAFEGEGHGFRKAENIKRTLDAELYFYSRIFGFELPDGTQPVDIQNLPAATGAGSR